MEFPPVQSLHGRCGTRASRVYAGPHVHQDAESKTFLKFLNFIFIIVVYVIIWEIFFVYELQICF